MRFQSSEGICSGQEQALAHSRQISTGVCRSTGSLTNRAGLRPYLRRLHLRPLVAEVLLVEPVLDHTLLPFENRSSEPPAAPTATDAGPDMSRLGLLAVRRHWTARPISCIRTEAAYTIGGGKAYHSDIHLECLLCADKAHGLPCWGAQRTRIWAPLVCTAWQDMLALRFIR